MQIRVWVRDVIHLSFDCTQPSLELAASSSCLKILSTMAPQNYHEETGQCNQWFCILALFD